MTKREMLLWVLICTVVLTISTAVNVFVGDAQRGIGKRSREYQRENRERIKALEESLRQ